MRGELPTYIARYEIIVTLAPNYPITWLTSIAKVHRSGYYKWLNRQDHLDMKDQEDKALKKLIVEIHLEYKMYGYPRIKEMLKERGSLVNHKKVYRLMCELQIQAIIRKKRRSHTGKPSRIFENPGTLAEEKIPQYVVIKSENVVVVNAVICDTKKG